MEAAGVCLEDGQRPKVGGLKKIVIGNRIVLRLTVLSFYGCGCVGFKVFARFVSHSSVWYLALLHELYSSASAV